MAGQYNRTVMSHAHCIVLAEADPSSGGVCVAVVDDDPQILEVLSAWLLTLGVTPCSFESAEDLLAAIETPPGKLGAQWAGAILDVNLKAIHGVDLAHRLRRLFPHIPLVMMSAMHPDEVADLGKLPAKAKFLPKPFDLDALESALFAYIQ